MSEEPEEIVTETVEETPKPRKRVKLLGVDSQAQEASESVDSEERPAKTLRTVSKSYRFETEHGTVTGTPQEFPADTADAIAALAVKSNVRLVVGDAAQR